MKQKLMLILATFVLSVGLATAQTRQVTGVVVTADHAEPVSGAMITVRGTNITAFTGSDGTFVLQAVPLSARTLTVSCLGMKKQDVAVKDFVQVLMDYSESALDEAIVVAYGTTTRNTFTGSASVVKADEIGKVQVNTPVEALNGRVAGVQFRGSSNQPGQGSPSILIRGITSVNASSTPLIVLDGTPFDGDMNLISAQDIESMTVLKDAASTALYGARAANGVILIQTKRGKNTDGHTTVTVDAKWGSNSRAIPDYNYITSPAKYYEVFYAALRNYASEVGGYSAAQAHNYALNNLIAGSNGLGYNVYTVPAGQTLIGLNGRLNPNATLGTVYGDYMVMPDDWADLIYNNGLRQEYTISASGNSGAGNFYASVNYLNNEGITIASRFERITSRLKTEYQVKDWLRLSGNFMYAHYRSNYLDNNGEDSYSGNLFSYATVGPIYPALIRDLNGNTVYDPISRTLLYDYGDGMLGANRPYLSQANPLSQVQLDRNRAEGNTFRAEGVAEISFLKDFKFTSRNTAFVDETRFHQTTNPWFGQYSSQNGNVVVEHSRQFTVSYQQLLNWAHVFSRHSVAAMVGHEYNRSRSYDLWGTRHNQWDPSNDELASAVIVDNTSSSRSDYNSERWLGRLEYNWAERYFAAVAVSREASSNFHPDHRWGTFYALSAAWRISQEPWFNLSWVDDLKLKASYGENGNDRIGSFNYINTYAPQNADGTASLVPNTLGNEKVTWETVGNFNVGIDFSLFKGRLSGSVEYFNRKTSDMLYFFPLAPSYGWSGYYTNIGDMRNSGIEVELVASIVRTRDFNWDVNFNLTHYKNKILSIPEEQKSTVVDGHGGFESGNKFFGEGLSMYTFHLRKYAGVNELGESLWYVNSTDAEGNTILETTNDINSADYYLCGTSLPDVYGGFGTSLTWKGFDFSIDFAYQLGGQVYDSDYAAAMGANRGSRGRMIHADLLKGYSLEAFEYDVDGNVLNPWTGSIPRLIFETTATQNGASDRWLTSASYLALQNITIGYTLPANLTKRFGVSKLRIYGAADNVWLWSKRQGLDPRMSYGGSASNQYYSPIRTISGGVTVTF
ncbi:MAG: SusC/RagA family TonB-linked outer membrane protein [Bacteroidaceae bacterium]|nr:SusC/RagA family TonB-linked outer membrane protein [Bacteroidaceae bacterium]